MYFRTFFFLLFIISSSLFFLAYYSPYYALQLCGLVCIEKVELNFLQLTSIIGSAISIVLFLISNYFTEKAILKEKERIAMDRLNIEEIHEELERLKN